MLRLPNTKTMTGWIMGAAIALAALTAAPAHAQDLSGLSVPQLTQRVDAEIAKAPNHNDSVVWGLFRQLEKLTAIQNEGGEGRPDGPERNNVTALYYCAKIGFFLLKNVAGNPDMFGGHVWPRTQRRISEALKMDGNHQEGWLLWGRIYSDRIGGPNWAEAERGFRFDIQLNPGRLYSKRFHVLSLMSLGKVKEALAAADHYLKSHPNDAKLHELRGDALYSSAQYQAAMQAYQATAGIALGNGDILDKVKAADLKHQDATTGTPMPDGYLQWLQTFYQQNPRQFISEEKRGHLLWTIWSGLWRGGNALAAQYGTQCVQCFAGLEQAFPEAGARRAVWCDYQADIYRHDPAQAAQLEAAVLRGLAADPSSQAVMDRLNLPTEGLNLFDYYKQHQRYTEGVAFVTKLLPLLPAAAPLDRARRAVMHQFAFECHKGLAQFTKAEAAIRAAMEADPRNSVYPNSYGLLLRYTGDLDGAAEQFHRALEIAPSHPWAAQNLAGLLMARGQWADFHDHCSRALYWAQDAVEQARADLTQTTDPQRVDGPASPQEIAAAQEAVEAAAHDLMKMRRLWLEGLQLERAAARK